MIDFRLKYLFSIFVCTFQLLEVHQDGLCLAEIQERSEIELERKLLSAVNLVDLWLDREWFPLDVSSLRQESFLQVSDTESHSFLKFWGEEGSLSFVFEVLRNWGFSYS